VSFVTYRDDYVDFAIAHPSQNDMLEKWCKENNKSKGVTGLSVDFNETPRIIYTRKIHNKVKQIAQDQTGILFLPVEFLYFFSMNRAEAIVSFKETLLNYPNIQGMILFCSMGQPLPNEFIEIPGYKDMLNIKTTNGKTINLFYITNFAYSGSLSEATIDKFRKALVNENYGGK
jgi:hypothetical protein